MFNEYLFNEALGNEKAGIHTITGANYSDNSKKINRTYVIGKDDDGYRVYGDDIDQTEIDLIGERWKPFLFPSIPSSADDIADSAINKQRLGTQGGYIIVPYHCAVEQWDVIRVNDPKCAQTNADYRVKGITVVFDKDEAKYYQKIDLCAV